MDDIGILMDIYIYMYIPSGKSLHNYGKTQYGKTHFLLGKLLTISMAIFNRYVKLPEGISAKHKVDH